LFEMIPPVTLTTSPPWNTAIVVQSWGSVLTDKISAVTGIFWDSTDSRLYYTSGFPDLDYGTAGNTGGDQYYPTLSFVTLNDSNSAAQSYGRWGYASRGFKKTDNGILAIPSDFASEFSVGRLASGFGGLKSSWTWGSASAGPALTAFDPPAIGTQGSYLSNTPLLGYDGWQDWTSGAMPTYNRCWRADDVLPVVYGNVGSDPDNSTYTNNCSTWAVSGDEALSYQGYSTTTSSYANNPIIGTKHWVPGRSFWGVDGIKQAGIWIQTANKEGILFVPTFSTGVVKYCGSTTASEGTNNKFMIYSRDQLASVAQGATESSIQPEIYHIQWPGTTCVEGVASQCGTEVTGVAFDSSNNSLYASVINYNTSEKVVYVYQVNDTTDISAPTAPSGLSVM
jgi:hypothetical protein